MSVTSIVSLSYVSFVSIVKIIVIGETCDEPGSILAGSIKTLKDLPGSLVISSDTGYKFRDFVGLAFFEPDWWEWNSQPVGYW